MSKKIVQIISIVVYPQENEVFLLSFNSDKKILDIMAAKRQPSSKKSLHLHRVDGSSTFFIHLFGTFQQNGYKITIEVLFLHKQFICISVNWSIDFRRILVIQSIVCIFKNTIYIIYKHSQKTFHSKKSDHELQKHSATERILLGSSSFPMYWCIVQTLSVPNTFHFGKLQLFLYSGVDRKHIHIRSLPINKIPVPDWSQVKLVTRKSSKDNQN